jgi:hypothetical protein
VIACYYLFIIYAYLNNDQEAKTNAHLYSQHRDDPNNYALNIEYVQRHLVLRPGESGNPPVAVTSLGSYRALERIKRFVSVFSQLSSGHTTACCKHWFLGSDSTFCTPSSWNKNRSIVLTPDALEQRCPHNWL